MRKNKSRLLFLAFLFLISFFVRIYKISETPIYPDEITWMVRGRETYLAIRGGNFGYFDDVWWEKQDDTEAIALPLTSIVGPWIVYLGKGQGIFSFEILPDFVAARIPIVILNSLFILFFWYFAKRITNQKIASFTALLLSVDPLMTANSKIVMNDSLLTIFMFLSVVSYFFIKNYRLSIIASAVFACLSFLTKPTGIFVVIPWLLQFLIKKEKRVLKKFMITMLSTYVLILFLWPGAWSDPFMGIFEYLIRQSNLANEGIRNFFFGQVTFNPPIYYYLFQITTRVPIFIVASLIGFIFLNLNKLKNYKDKPKMVSILIYLTLFLVAMSLSSKKLGARYILPLWPWIYLAASFAIIKFLTKQTRTIKVLLTSAVFLISLFTNFSYLPNLDLFYNKLIGGPKGAQRYDLVGLCYGAKETTEFINKCFPEQSSFAYIGCSKPAASYYTDKQISTDWKDEKVVAIENSYSMLLPDAPAIEKFKDINPIFTAEQKGAVLAYIYSPEKVNCTD